MNRTPFGWIRSIPEPPAPFRTREQLEADNTALLVLCKDITRSRDTMGFELHAARRRIRQLEAQLHQKTGAAPQ